MRKQRITAAATAAALLAGSVQAMSAAPVSAAAEIDYAKALQMSLYFYECQQAGKLPEWNRVEWRADSTVNDDVNGGWYDAGDHVKFNLPMSYSACMLAWGLYMYPDAVDACGELTNYVNNLTFVLDYFVACDLGDSVVFQVGNGQKDHTWWGPVELLEYGMVDQGNSDPRGHLEGRDCSAVTAQMGAALAAGYCALQGMVDTKILDSYLVTAENFFELADADRSDATYNGSDAQGFYESRQFYDDLFYCANWLYMATGEQSYLDKAATYIPNLGTELGQGNTLKYSWCHCWDDVQQGASLLYAINTGDATWKAQVKKHLEYWRTSSEKISGSDVIYVQNWGCLRYANTFAFVCAVACDTLFADDPNYNDYVKLYEEQINYTLGDNADSRSYVVGYSENSPRNAHHRTAHASWKNSLEEPDLNRHILYGALVGGPLQSGDYEDDRGNYINNEVATDYNAGFTAMLCKMIDKYGGKSDSAFPYPETRDDEFFVEAKATHDSGGTTVSMKITNHTAWPARIVDNISMRYYMDLSELIDAGLDPTTVEMRCDRDQSAMYAGVATAVISKPQQYSGSIYYVEVTFPDGRAFMPISEGQHQCEILLALVYPNYGKGWDAANDYSAQGLGGTENEKTQYIPVYENGQLIYGVEPDGTTGKGSISASPSPNGTPQQTTPTSTTTKPTETTTTVQSTASETTAAPDGDFVWGDADCSGLTDVSDAVMAARFSLSDPDVTISQQGQRNCDVTKDNVITSDDVLMIVRYIAGYVDPTAE